VRCIKPGWYAMGDVGNPEERSKMLLVMKESDIMGVPEEVTAKKKAA
jgi:hypothetical protein